MSRHYLLVLLFSACNEVSSHNTTIHLTDVVPRTVRGDFIKDIPVPADFERMTAGTGSFGEWLRSIRLKKSNEVYLYDGSLKKNQSAQFAVLNITVGKKDLQQCADAVMRLRAEYLFDRKRYNEICFYDNNNKPYKWEGADDRIAFTRYLENVFGWCGSASLQKQLNPLADWRQLQPGDVFIKGGFPGHAMIVMDVAQNKKGQKVFMLAQSYMPAQDIHVVKNPMDPCLSPWYEIGDNSTIVTPEWTFRISQLYRF